MQVLRSPRLGLIKTAILEELLRVLSDELTFAVSLSLDSQSTSLQVDLGTLSTRAALLSAKKRTFADRGDCARRYATRLSSTIGFGTLD